MSFRLNVLPQTETEHQSRAEHFRDIGIIFELILSSPFTQMPHNNEIFNL